MSRAVAHNDLAAFLALPGRGGRDDQELVARVALARAARARHKRRVRWTFDEAACDCGTPSGYHTSDCAGFTDQPT